MGGIRQRDAICPQSTGGGNSRADAHCLRPRWLPDFIDRCGRHAHGTSELRKTEVFVSSNPGNESRRTPLHARGTHEDLQRTHTATGFRGRSLLEGSQRSGHYGSGGRQGPGQRCGGGSPGAIGFIGPPKRIQDLCDPPPRLAPTVRQTRVGGPALRTSDYRQSGYAECGEGAAVDSSRGQGSDGGGCQANGSDSRGDDEAEYADGRKGEASDEDGAFGNG